MWTGALSAALGPDWSSNGPQAIRMTPEQTDEVVAAIGATLKDAELTVDELGDAVVAATGSWAGDLVVPAFQSMWPRWRQALALAGLRGALCFGPNRGRKVTYTNPRRWLPGFRPADGQAALAELVRRYLQAYGPATPQQFSQWLAVPRGWATQLFGSLCDDLQQVEFDGTAAWVVTGDTVMPSRPPRGLRLLPYFDAYVVGSHPRELVFPGRAAQRALGGGQAGNFPVLLIDGIVAGVWHQRRSGRKIQITVEPLEDLTPASRRELADQVERVADILEGIPELTIGTVTVGAHA